MLQIDFIPYFWFILMFQLPVPGSCCILKLSRDIPKLPRIEFPNSFSFPKASSLSLDIFSSYNICSFRLKYVMTAVKWKCACDSSIQKGHLHLFIYLRIGGVIVLYRFGIYRRHANTYKHCWMRPLKVAKMLWCVPVSASSYFSSFSYESIRLANTFT